MRPKRARRPKQMRQVRRRRDAYAEHEREVDRLAREEPAEPDPVEARRMLEWEP